MLDNYGRNIDYVRVSLTGSCNLRCLYCMPEKGSENIDGDILSYEEILLIISKLSELGIKKVRFTGGEPLIYKDIDRLIYETSKIKGIEDISITTNGVLLDERIEDLKTAGLKRININLCSLNSETYKKITRIGNLDKVLNGLYKSKEVGIKPIKINTVLMKGYNDNEIDDFLRLSIEEPFHVRFIELMPIGEGKIYYDKGCSMSLDEVIKSHEELKNAECYREGTALVYKMKEAKGTIGFIEPVSCKFCDSCSKIRLTSNGKIKPCLHSREEIDLRNFIHDDAKLGCILKDAIMGKPKEHKLDIDNVSLSARPMYQIGG